MKIEKETVKKILSGLISKNVVYTPFGWSYTTDTGRVAVLGKNDSAAIRQAARIKNLSGELLTQNQLAKASGKSVPTIIKLRHDLLEAGLMVQKNFHRLFEPRASVEYILSRPNKRVSQQRAAIEESLKTPGIIVYGYRTETLNSGWQYYRPATGFIYLGKNAGIAIETINKMGL